MINIPYLILAVVLVILLIYIARHIKHKVFSPFSDMYDDLRDNSANAGEQDNTQDASANDIANIDSTDTFSSDFFARVEKGESSMHFISLTYQNDSAVIQSLLKSADIPSFAEFEHTNLSRGGGLWPSESGTNIRLSILANDYDNAKTIVDQYIKNKNQGTFGITYL